MEWTFNSILELLTFLSVLAGMAVLIIDRTTGWFKNRDAKATDKVKLLDDISDVNKMAEDCQKEIAMMIRANQETNTQIGKLHDLIKDLNEHGSNGAAIMMEKFENKLDGFSGQLNGLNKRLVKLETLIMNGKKEKLQ